MAQAWPTALPQNIKRGSFTETPIDPRIRTQTEYGPQKIRLRETKMRYIVSVTLELTSSEYATLKNYVQTTLGFGIQTFEFYHPQRQTNVEYRLVELPTYADLGGDHFTASWTMEEI
tara:strand:+ start:3084 stop:3434 length:351 start_codon:yes stop_codon:yes gene_type:complete